MKKVKKGGMTDARMSAEADIRNELHGSGKSFIPFRVSLNPVMKDIVVHYSKFQASLKRGR